MAREPCGVYDPPALRDTDADEGPVDLSWVWLWDRRTGELREVPITEARCDVLDTHYWPWHWIGLLAAGQIVATPDAFLGTDARRLERCAL